MKAAIHRWYNTKRVVIYGTSDIHYQRVSNELLIYNIQLRKCIPKFDIISNQQYLYYLIKSEEMYEKSVRYEAALSLVSNIIDIIPDTLHAHNRTAKTFFY